MELAISLIVIKALYDANIITDFNFSFLNRKIYLKLDDDIYTFIIKLLWYTDKNWSVFFYINMYHKLSMSLSNRNSIEQHLTNLIRYIKKDYMDEYLSVKNDILLNIEKIDWSFDDFNADLSEDNSESLILDNFEVFEDILNYWKTTLLAGWTWSGKSTQILNIIYDIFLNNSDVKIVYFWSHEIIPKEFYIKLWSIIFNENLSSKYKYIRKIKAELNKKINIKSIKEKDLTLKEEDFITEKDPTIIRIIKEDGQNLLKKYNKKKKEYEEILNLINLTKEDITLLEEQQKKNNWKFYNEIKAKITLETISNKQKWLDKYELQLLKVQEDLNIFESMLGDLETLLDKLEEYIQKYKTAKKNKEENTIDYVAEMENIIETIKDHMGNFNQEYNKYLIKKEEEYKIEREYLQKKYDKVKEIVGQRLMLQIRSNINIEEVIKITKELKDKNLYIIIDYAQLLESKKNFFNDMEKMQYMAKEILQLSKMKDKNVGFLLASQVTANLQGEIIGENDVRWFKDLIHILSWMMASVNLESKIPYNERNPYKKNLNFLYMVKNRDGDLHNAYYTYNRNLKFERLDPDLEELAKKENFISSKKVDVKFAYKEDLEEYLGSVQIKKEEANNNVVNNNWNNTNNPNNNEANNISKENFADNILEEIWSDLF